MLDAWMQSYRPEELFDAHGTIRGRSRGARAHGRSAHGRESTCQRRPAAARSPPARLPRLRRGRAGAWRGGRRGHTRPRAIPARRRVEPTMISAIFGSSDQTKRSRTGSTRCSKRPTGNGRRRRGRTTSGSRLTAVCSRCSASISARDGSKATCSRAVTACSTRYEAFVAHRGLDVQPAREMVEGHARVALAAADRLVQLPALEPCVAAGQQRLHASGSGLHRSRGQQEGGGRARLSPAGRELPVERDGSLSPQPATTSTSSSPESIPRRNGWTWMRPSGIARQASESWSGRAPTPAASRIS